MNYLKIANCVHGLGKIKEEIKILSTIDKLSLSQRVVWIMDALSFVLSISSKIIAVERVQLINWKKLFRPYRIHCLTCLFSRLAKF